jgi:endonuclease/exonuclease/phosphatase family metal-dependent hydrolase
MRLASYNVENLFQRARAMNEATWAEGRDVLKAHADMNRILGKEKYTAADKTQIVALMTKLGIEKQDDAGPWVILRQNRGHLVTRRTNGKIDVVANGRADWIGWLELKVEPVNAIATRMTARVITDLAPDVLGVVEAEDRPSLVRFCKDVMMTESHKHPFEHIMLIDGNDERGIDVAVMTRKDYDILGVRSHVDDMDETGPVFSRDCAVYTLQTAAGNRLTVLVNHLKSKGFGTPAASNAKRQRQAARIRAIYNDLRSEGATLVAVIGDLNDTPDSAPLKPLLKSTDLKDISTHAQFDSGGFPGTFGGATASNKIDYILLSPELMAKVTGGGVFRKGVWPGVKPKKWEVYAEIKEPIHAASDHAAIWADIDI